MDGIRSKMEERTISEVKVTKDLVEEKIRESLNSVHSRSYENINPELKLILKQYEEEDGQHNNETDNVSTYIKALIYALLVIYFCWATYYQLYVLKINIFPTLCDGYGLLIILYGLFIFGIIYVYIFKPYVEPHGKRYIWNPSSKFLHSFKFADSLFYIVFFSALSIFFVIDTANDRYRLISLNGILIFLFLGYIMCPAKSQIPWRTIINGLVLQFILALLIITSQPGREIFQCIGRKIATFLGYSAEGSAFVYGDYLVNAQAVFAFKCLTAIYFFGFLMNILYYYGIMQKFVSNLGEFLQFILGASVCESVGCAANIFVGMGEALIILKPFLNRLTNAEIHALMTCGLATTSATVWSAYISFGADAATIVTASVMSAPWALCFSKLIYPEIEEPEITPDNAQLTTLSFSSVLEAASTGASEAVKLVLNITAGVIACLSFIYFINGCLIWMGILVGYTAEGNIWTVNSLVGKVFVPIAFVMGVPWQDCYKVGELIGLKTMINEFVAFQQMSTVELLPRSKTIATFAIAGFANPGSMGILISLLSVLIPNKAHEVTGLVYRAAAGGAITSIMTASIAALFIPSDSIP